MTLKLHDNFLIEIGEHIEIRWRTVKKNYSKELEKYEEKKFYPIAIYTKTSNLICYASEINEFLELLGAFVANQLNTQKDYGFIYKGGGGFKANIKTKDKIKYLHLQIGQEEFFLEKYDCRVIIANAKQILSKCTLKEFI